MSGETLGFVHRFVRARDSSQRVLLLLHGTGGDENDLIPLGRELIPGAGLLSPRGKVLEHGAPRFFRRLAEGVFDVEDLRLRAHELADFVAAAASTYDFDLKRVAAVGYSNGANIAAAVLLLRPEILESAVLLRAMVPLVPDRLPDLSGVGVFISSGRQDPIVGPEHPVHLASLLNQAGADVTLLWQPSGHELIAADIQRARAWLAAWRPAALDSR